MSQQFLDYLRSVDPATNGRAHLLIDTNVAVDFFSIADVLRVGDSPLLFGSPSFKYRLSRARHAAILMSWLNREGLRAGMLGNETDDLLDRLAPKVSTTSDGVARAFTSAIMHVVCDHVTEWPLGALTEVDHSLEGTDADDELLRMATADGLAIVTNEEHTVRGIVPNPKKLRSRARAAGVAAYTAQEYLEANRVDVAAECRRFLLRLAFGVEIAKSRNVLGGSLAIDDLVGLYRMILLGEFAPPPPWPFDKR